jgi:alkyl hydroperoxide reductase subunit AhpC
VLSCSTDSIQVHQAWQNAHATEEEDGLGAEPSFPMLGDKNQRLCRALDVLDESTGLAYHVLILLDRRGDVIYRERANGEHVRVS